MHACFESFPEGSHVLDGFSTVSGGARAFQAFHAFRAVSCGFCITTTQKGIAYFFSVQRQTCQISVRMARVIGNRQNALEAVTSDGVVMSV